MILVPDPRVAPGAIVRRLEQAFAARREQDEWIDRVEFLGGIEALALRQGENPGR